ncbi:hypothetical protein OEZ86_004765 [Tetradesmus obliquus]|nr:hypothetical protein OEZ86_004765 [Tetradesmus obliquus]
MASVKASVTFEGIPRKVEQQARAKKGTVSAYHHRGVGSTGFNFGVKHSYSSVPAADTASVTICPDALKQQTAAISHWTDLKKGI